MRRGVGQRSGRPMIERRPQERGWDDLGAAMTDRNTVSMSRWQSGPVRVVSSLILAELPGRSGTGLQWLISVSRRGKRPKRGDVERALRAFDMQEAEEDNHHPGVARYFFLVCDPKHRVDCECKEDEVTVVDDDGFTWQNPVDESECRGCEYESWFGKPCSVHSEGRHAR